jgi:ubiquinone/menaquinone biosynthesis C-methylase UbiE
VSTTAAFDLLAPAYDDLWTNTAVGRLQREAVWRHAGRLFAAGETVLDLGCGTGEDAVLLGERGVQVVATDSSCEMVRMARSRGVDARLIAMEQIGWLRQTFDGALSNFGALNCLPDVSVLREPLIRMIRPGGYLVLCVIGRFCLWESFWYAAHGHFRKAVRRWGGQSSSSLGLTAFYPRVDEIRDTLSPEFGLIQTVGIGVCVPPSYVRGLPLALLPTLAAADRHIAALPGVRALADHRLLVFRRS